MKLFKSSNRMLSSSRKLFYFLFLQLRLEWRWD